jgi:uncharacterized protein YbbC (DUF1343 family)
MIQGETWLDGLGGLQLTVVPMQGWQRSMRWPHIGRAWVPTSPNIPTYESALAYPGMGFVGETAVNEGRGTPAPFTLLGAPWLDADRIAARLDALALPGVRFEPAEYTPRSIPDVARHPRWAGTPVAGARLVVTDAARFQPLETGIHILAALVAEARSRADASPLRTEGLFDALAGTKRLRRMLEGGSDGRAIIAAWQAEVARFRALRARYLLY